jgi:hypothetical protein
MTDPARRRSAVPPDMEQVMDERSLMREWASSPFRLELYELGEPSLRREDGKTPIGYRFYHDDQLVFEGDDIAVPAGQTLDGDQTVRGVLGFVALGPGDVEADYFARYTPAQLAWRDQHAEDLAGLLAEWDDPDAAGPG